MKLSLPALLFAAAATAPHGTAQDGAARDVAAQAVAPQIGAAQAGAPSAIATRIARAVAAVSKERIQSTVATLVAFGTRHVLSRTDVDTAGTGAARAWLEAQFAAIAAQSGGRLEVALQRQRVPCQRPGMPAEIEIVNVLATLRGATDPKRVYVVGGHYDSRNGNGADGTGLAPGANDDASGTALALEVCRVLADQTFAATLVFCAYDAEEQGLLGSKAHADALAAADEQVDGMITCDIVGNTLGVDGVVRNGHVRCFSYAPSGNDSTGRSMARAMTWAAHTHVPGFLVELVFRGDRYGRGGDHRSFFDAGFPAVRLTEPREDFSRQHQDIVPKDGKPYGDLPEFVDAAYTANVARVVAAALAELAAAPRPPRVLRAELSRTAYDTLLEYELPDGTDDCEFVWRRTTAPDWEGVVAKADAGIAPGRGARQRATLKGLCLDDLVVGVRSIGSDGARSRVATPAEPDRFTQRPTGERR